jgi:hypothetical protein
METKRQTTENLTIGVALKHCQASVFYAFAIGLKEVDQVIVWDRGHPVRPDASYPELTLLVSAVSGRAGRPRSQDNHLKR